MTSGLKTRIAETWHRVVAATAAPVAFLLLPLLLLLAAGPASALELDELMPLLAARQSGEARFTEQRFVSGFDQPLEASGTLSFKAPDRFSRTTTMPRAEQMKVEGNTVTLTRSGRTRQMSLDTAPEMTAIVEAMRGTLSGNAATLRKYFRPEVTGSKTRWQLKLLPIDDRLASRVRWLRIDGAQGELRSVEVQMPDGDRSMMLITPL